MNNRKGLVKGEWDVGFHSIVEKARKEYSNKLGKNLSMRDVTRIWADRNLTRFRYPKLRLRGRK